MKKLLLIVATLVITAAVFAGNPASTAKYCCTKCSYTSAKAGKCPTCKTTLVKEGTYYCTKCDGVTSAKAGKCPKCGGTMVKMEVKKTTDKKTM